MIKFCSHTSLNTPCSANVVVVGTVLGLFGNFHFESKQKTDLPLGKSMVTIMLVELSFLVVVVQSRKMFLIELVCIH